MYYPIIYYTRLLVIIGSTCQHLTISVISQNRTLRCLSDNEKIFCWIKFRPPIGPSVCQPPPLHLILLRLPSLLHPGNKLNRSIDQYHWNREETFVSFITTSAMIMRRPSVLSTSAATIAVMAFVGLGPGMYEGGHHLVRADDTFNTNLTDAVGEWWEMGGRRSLESSLCLSVCLSVCLYVCLSASSRAYVFML